MRSLPRFAGLPWLGLGLAIAIAMLASGCARDSKRSAETVRAFDPDSVPEAYRYSMAALAWPGATRAFQITPAGDLYNGEWTLRITGTSAGAACDSPRVIAYEDRWMPVAHWVRRSGALRWEFEAVALPEGDAPRGWRLPFRLAPGIPDVRDSGLVLSLSVRASNRGSAAEEGALDLVLSDPDRRAAFVAFDAPETSGAWRWASGRGSAPAHGFSTLPQEGATVRMSVRLEPGASRTERFVIPAYPTSEAALARWSRPTHEQRASEARRHWTSEMERGARFALGDPEVESALRAARVVLLESRERRNLGWVPIGGPLYYRDVWLRDGARAAAALAMSGYTAESRALARSFLAFQWPVGAFVSQRGQLDGTGQALWAFEQTLLRPALADSVDPCLDAAIRAWRWIEWQRALGRTTGWKFGSMLPFAEPRDNEVTRAQLTGNDAWAIAGYRATARLALAAGRQAVADSIEISRGSYIADFRAALERSGSPDVPPSWQGSGRDWGNLGVSHPCAVLAPEDPRVAALARRVWAFAGGPGLLSYGHRDSLHYYVGADLVTWAMRAGERESADRMLQAMLDWRSASGGAGELFSASSRDFGSNLPPHGTSAAAIVSVVRNALIYDDGDTLELTLGARDRWWRGAQVNGAPTRWGTLDLEFAREGSEARWKWSAVPVWTVLTLPPGTRLASDPPAPLRRGARDDRVLAPPGTREAKVAFATR